MNRKVTSIVAYITIIGWIIAFIAGDRQGAKFHLNQALVLWLLGIIGGIIGWLPIPIISGVLSAIISLFCFVCWIIGLVYAATDKEKPLPLIGMIHLLN